MVPHEVDMMPRPFALAMAIGIVSGVCFWGAIAALVFALRG